MAKAKIQTIFDVDGKVLYQEAAATKKELIQTLVARRMSLAGADLSNLSLRHMNFRGADLAGAKFDNSNLSGSIFSNANLCSASLRRSRLTGVEAQRARFEGAFLEEADFAGSTVSFSSFRGAHMSGANLARCNASSTIFAHVEGKGANFSGSKLKNADFSNVMIQNADFRGANLSTTLSLAEEHLPDRTRDAIVIDCLYDDETVLCGSVGAMKRDATRSGWARMLRWFIPAGLVTTAMIAAPGIEAFFKLESLEMPTSGGFILLLGLAATVKVGIEEWLRERAANAVGDLQLRYRQAMATASRLARSKSDLIAAVARRADLEPLKLALEAIREGQGAKAALHRFLWMVSDNDAVIICERQHLAMALYALSSNESRRYPLKRDVILVNAGAISSDLSGPPSALRFHEDGSMTALWGSGEKPIARVVYPARYGSIIACDPEGTLLPACPDKVTAIARFRAAILESSGLAEFAYPTRSHYVQPGKDGTILVYQASSRRLDNPIGPAVIKPDGEMLNFRNGSPNTPHLNGPADDEDAEVISPAF